MCIIYVLIVLYAVLDGGIESALYALNSAYGDQTKMTCTPLRSFENFAVQVLDVDQDLATPFKRIVKNGDEQLFWLTFSISYRGSCSS